MTHGKALHIYLSPTARAELERLSAAAGVSASAIIRKLLEESSEKYLANYGPHD